MEAALRALKRREARLKRELAQVQHKTKEVERALRPAPLSHKTRLSPEGREAISRATTKRWAEYRRKQRKDVRKRRPK